jgi:hypothetical protein
MGNPKKASISVDMDPIIHYLNARGYTPLEVTNLNAVYDDALPKFLDFFDEFNLIATFFVVGQDARNIENTSKFREIVRRGHEIANHSYSHHQHFIDLSFKERYFEIEEADKVLSDVTGQKICGFRAPGWGINYETLDILEQLEYTYDSSVFPSTLISLLAYANWILNKGKLKRSLGSSTAIGLAPKIPYKPARKTIWKRGDMNIVEMPPTVLPIIQLPFLGTFLYLFGAPLFKLSFKYFSYFTHPLLYELHGIELVDYYTSINDTRLTVKPGLDKTMEEKRHLYRLMLSTFSRKYQFFSMKEIARAYR